jgi:hypothetical protein
MKRLGFSYVPFAAVVESKGAGGSSAADLREHGYGIAEAMELVMPKDPNDQPFRALSPADQGAYSIALDGKETDGVRSPGCKQLAEGGLEADIVMARITKSGETFMAAMNADPEIRKIDAAWAECMRSKGYASVMHPSEVVANVVRPLQSRMLADNTLTKGERVDRVRRRSSPWHVPTRSVCLIRLEPFEPIGEYLSFGTLGRKQN